MITQEEAILKLTLLSQTKAEQRHCASCAVMIHAGITVFYVSIL